MTISKRLAPLQTLLGGLTDSHAKSAAVDHCSWADSMLREDGKTRRIDCLSPFTSEEMFRALFIAFSSRLDVHHPGIGKVRLLWQAGIAKLEKLLEMEKIVLNARVIMKSDTRYLVPKPFQQHGHEPGRMVLSIEVMTEVQRWR